MSEIWVIGMLDLIAFTGAAIGAHRTDLRSWWFKGYFFFAFAWGLLLIGDIDRLFFDGVGLLSSSVWRPVPAKIAVCIGIWLMVIGQSKRKFLCNPRVTDLNSVKKEKAA